MNPRVCHVGANPLGPSAAWEYVVPILAACAISLVVAGTHESYAAEPCDACGCADHSGLLDCCGPSVLDSGLIRFHTGRTSADLGSRSPVMFHDQSSLRGLKCRFGFGCIDTDLRLPRTWEIWNIRQRSCPKLIRETDELLLDDWYYQPAWRVSGDLYRDFCNFHAKRSLTILGLSLGLHAVLANTELDQQFRDSLQRRVANNHDDFQIGRTLGDVWTAVPAVIAIWSMGECLAQEQYQRNRYFGSKLQSWGVQTSRALGVGATVTGVLQVAIGSSRPDEPNGSKWHPFADNNGVSGHALVGAVPFLVAAHRCDNRAMKAVWIAASMISGYSRLHHDAHYLSQVLLGWSIAYLAVEATELTNAECTQYRIVPFGREGCLGVGVEFRY